MEQWKTIPVAPKYEVSNYGRIRTSKTGRIRKQRLNKREYMDCTIVAINGKPTTYSVHRLVAKAFVNNPEPLLYEQIDHIDRDKINNHADNLRWCNTKMNIHWFHKNKYGEDWKPKHRPTKKEIEQRKKEREEKKRLKREQMKYGSVEKMVKDIGKPIIVNGDRYDSCGSAAQYIIDSEKDIGNDRNKKTISKELRKFLKNGNQKGYMVMYGRYTAEPAS